MHPYRARVTRLRGARGPDDGRGYWRAEHHVDGQTITVWTGWATVDEVAAQLRRLLSEEGVRRPGDDVDVEAPVRTWADLADRWWADTAEDRRNPRTASGYQLCAEHLNGVIGDVLLSELGETTFVEAVRTWRRRGYAESTIMGRLSVASQVVRWGAPRGYCRPVRMPGAMLDQRARVRNRYTPTREEAVAVVEHLNGWARIAGTLLLVTGARIGEVAYLAWDDVRIVRESRVLGGRSYEATLVRLTLGADPSSSKTGARTIEIEDESLAGGLAVQRLAAMLLDGPPDARPARISRPDLVVGVAPNTTHRTMRDHLADACRELGVPVFTPHGLRRSLEDHMSDEGVDIAAWMAWFGHSAATALSHYRRATRRGLTLAGRVAAVPDRSEKAGNVHELRPLGRRGKR